ncbi:DUF2812 domain-containing protein [Paenibacillus sp. FSL H7-0716]|uniref:DUF2812 domain-containing protein n=1 Tax=Paenibacillus odorifer TaxID=189426 RepID=A0AB36JL69_9BACL|nr:DUF2812 domain-containing protein [Paenibacillus odorifer]OME23711.1 hypothetical protein BSK47_04500 [Paenibacillus odorifer]
MKHVVRKLIWDYEKEEKWLNEMSAKGMALSELSWCKYVFTETPNNEYTYRIELLDNLPDHTDSIKYLKFLEENGIDCVSTYMRWVYLRKKSVEGPFDIYTDLESRIKHYKRINRLWKSVMWLELILGLFNVMIGVINYSFSSQNLSMVNVIMGGMLILLGLAFLILGAPIRKKIKKLQLENLIIE